MHPLLHIAIKAARNASKIILRALDRLDKIAIEKKNNNELVTEIDRLAEEEIITIIHQMYPTHAIYGEETGASGNDHEYTWIIDPLDGTANYVHGIPHFSISIAAQHRDIIECGLVYDPLRQELFTAEQGGGAYLNNRRIRVGGHGQLHEALLGVGFAHNNSDSLQTYISSLKTIELQTAGVRRTGSSALDLAYVAAGRLDGVWEFNLRPWDIAAGSLLVKEAGGWISDFAGENKYLTNGNVIAANPKLFKQLLKTIQECVQQQQ